MTSENGQNRVRNQEIPVEEVLDVADGEVVRMPRVAAADSVRILVCLAFVISSRPFLRGANSINP